MRYGSLDVSSPRSASSVSTMFSVAEEAVDVVPVRGDVGGCRSDCFRTGGRVLKL
jgi:hypothetical protein